MSPNQLTLFYFFLFLSFSINAQIDANSLMGLPTTANLTDVSSLTGVSQGNIVYIENEDALYIFDGTNWKAILDTESSDDISNELFFEDVNYYYVSVSVNTIDWMVTRYDRTDINTEGNAMGTGTQPTDLATVSGLSY